MIDNKVEVYSKYQDGKEILRQCYKYENDGTQNSSVLTRFNTKYESLVSYDEILFYRNNVSIDISYLKYITREILDNLLIPKVLVDIIILFITY